MIFQLTGFAKTPVAIVEYQVSLLPYLAFAFEFLIAYQLLLISIKNISS